MKKVLSSFILALSMASAAYAQETATIGDVKYLLDEGEATILEQPDDLAGDIVVPSTVTYNGTEYTVNRVLDNAFKDTKITSISLPKTLVKIGYGVCENCDKLISASLPEGMTTITKSFFYDCDALTDIALPKNLTSIGDYCFYSCDILTSINLSSNITKLGKDCFYSCNKLGDISFPIELDTLGEECFAYCTGITDVSLPENTQSLGNSCFKGCSNLEKVTLPNNNISLGSSCFAYCTKLKDITLSIGLSSLPDHCFIDCTELEEITLPNSITKVGYSCFNNCSSLKNVTLSNSLIELGEYCFYGCTSLSAIHLPSTITTLGECCFYKCSDLKTVTLPSSITFIGDWCFKDCVNLFKVTCQWESLSTLTLGLCSFNYNYENLHFSNIYSDAELYVPNGTIELYKTNYPWNNFKYIYEKGGTNAPTEQCAMPTIGYADGKLTFSSSTTGAEYHYTITDDDILANGYSEDGSVALSAAYNIRAYASADGYQKSDMAEAKLCFVGGSIDATSIDAAKQRGVIIETCDGTVNVNGLTDGETVSLYSLSGVMLSSAKASAGTASLNVPTADNIVIVKIGGDSVKLTLKK